MCLVTISSGRSKFSTGFDNKSWMDETKRGEIGTIKDVAEFWAMLSKLMGLGMATMAVVNGHTYGSGVFFALAHDFRTMISSEMKPKAKFCLPEAQIGFPMPLPVSKLLDATVSPVANRIL